MRKVEQDMLKAIHSKSNWKCGNTEVQYLPLVQLPYHARAEQAKVFLHGNQIATVVYENGLVYVTLVAEQWPTRTTTSRLRALGIDARVYKGELKHNFKALIREA